MRSTVHIIGEDLLVFPAASKPSMSRRISLDPKILLIILETEPPMVEAMIDSRALNLSLVVQTMLLVPESL